MTFSKYGFKLLKIAEFMFHVDFYFVNPQGRKVLYALSRKMVYMNLCYTALQIYKVSSYGKDLSGEN